ncbi:MAG: DMT family transporter [Rhodobacteraceae bacterium]|nr:DMT family transporter [Paracoccaceae bacterium]
MALTDNMRGAALMAFAMLVFAVNDTCMKLVLGELPLFQSVLIRGLLTSVALVLIAPRLGGLRFRISRRDAMLVALRSLSEVLATVTFLTALRHMPFANLSAIMQALPLAVTLAAALFLGEAVGWRRLAAIATGFVGVLLIVQPGADGFTVWSLLGLASVACVVLRDLSTRRLSSDVTSVTVSLSAAASVTIMAACAAPFEGWAPVAPRHLVLIAAASGFLIAGYLTIVMAMRVGEISLVAPFRYTALLFSILLGWMVFGEFPGSLILIGGAIVVGSGIYTFYRERRLGQKVAAPPKAELRIR